MSLVQDIALKYKVSVGIVQFFAALSKPLRKAFYNYLEAQKAVLIIERTKLVGRLARSGDISDTLNTVITSIGQLLDPVVNVLRNIPIDSATMEVVKENLPEVSKFLGDIAGSIPLKIPTTVATALTGMGGFSLLEGVNSLKDLQDKIYELRFRLARATSLKAYATTGLAYCDNQTDKITKYLQVIVTLNMDI